MGEPIAKAVRPNAAGESMAAGQAGYVGLPLITVYFFKKPYGGVEKKGGESDENQV